MKRRDFLYIGGSVVAVSAFYGANMMGGMMNRGSMMGQGGMGGGMMSRQRGSSNIGSLQPLKQELPIPKLLEGKRVGNTYHYNLTIQESEYSFFKYIKTKTYAVNGTYLAPTLRLINGTNVSINYKNNLSEPTTMYGHGMHLPAKYDGGLCKLKYNM